MTTVTLSALRSVWCQFTEPLSADKDLARREYMTKVILLIMAVLSIFLIPIFSIGGLLGVLPLDSLLITVGMTVVFTGGWALAYRGYWKLVRIIPPAVMFLIAIYGNWIGGVGAPAMIFYANSILLTAMLYSERRHWLTLLIGLACYIGIYWGQVNRYLTQLRDVQTAFANRVVISIGAYVTLAALIWFLLNQLKRALVEARAYSAQVTERTMELTLSNQQLEAEIVERWRVEAELRESEEKFRTFIEQSADGLSLTDEHGQVIEWNQAQERLSGIPRTEVIGIPLWELQNKMAFPGKYDVHASELLKQSMTAWLQTGVDPFDGQAQEIEFHRTNGDDVFIHQTAFRIKTAQGFRLGSITRDVTDSKRSQAEREKLIVELEAKNAELERFTYTVSHDLKAPLITIRGFLGFLERDVRGNDLNHMQSDMRHIKEAVDKMAQLLNDLLELSRIGRKMNPPTYVPFKEIVDDALQLLQEQLRVSGVRVIIGSDLPVIYGDRNHIVEVVQNLLDNAIKFRTIQSDPRVEIGWYEADSPGVVTLFVRDGGIGIEPQYFTKIFGLFEKLDSQTDGTGVGLALVKRIIEVHGGCIWVESAGLNQGSTFYFTLPTAEKPK